LLYQADKLVAVESVNLPADHLAARKLLEAGIAVAPALASDATFALNSHLPSAAPAVKRPVS
jgi:3-phenylpropionate/trans-cinnamate dioxygenase ferredoxin reductase subunit